mmetsp:Transcript_8656/g.15623  ORF Transcript_8656/g.15623 Transcript_8656/m.15623 type:complete len:306 (+) Transcript_8656:2152-3069(+)
MLHFTVTEMLGQTKINHLEFGILGSRRKQKVFQLEISVNNPFAVQIPDGTQHLFDQTSTFGFRVMIVGLFIQSIKEFTTQTQLLYQIDFRMTFIDFLQSYNVGMIQLAHDEDFFSQLCEAFLGINQPQIQTLDGIFYASCLVGNQSNQARDSRSQDGSRMDTVVDFFNRFPKGNFHVDDIGSESSLFATTFNHGIQSNHAGRVYQGLVIFPSTVSDAGPHGGGFRLVVVGRSDRAGGSTTGSGIAAARGFAAPRSGHSLSGTERFDGRVVLVRIVHVRVLIGRGNGCRRRLVWMVLIGGTTIWLG